MQTQRMMRWLITSVSASSLFFIGCTQQSDLGEASPTTQTHQPETSVQEPKREAEVPYVPTPQEVVEQMLELADVSGDDILYDLGSGDGRITIAAAQEYGARAIGVEINPGLVQISQENAQAANVSERVEFVQQDLFDVDLSEATVVTLYLLPEVNLRLRPKLLQELEPGTRIVSHDFDMGEWKPERVVRVQGPDREHTLYYWVVPEEIPESLS
ncbi:MAG: class I SAM-dependent methyltransferase [Cyanophyceae cyanobacterium]